MQSPKFNKKLTLRRASLTQDTGSGENIETWSNIVDPIWASRRRASARETLASAEIAAAITDVFEFRKDSAWADLSPIDRVIFGGREYDIISVDPDGRLEGLSGEGMRVTAVARAE
mgnify:FL=1